MDLIQLEKDLLHVTSLMTLILSGVFKQGKCNIVQSMDRMIQNTKATIKRQIISQKFALYMYVCTTPYNILWAMFLCSCSTVNYCHIFTTVLVFLCFLLTVMLVMLAPIPKQHAAIPTSTSGYAVGTAISNQPIQIEITAI
jgi:glucan phosphoethanolaminetransferase (alkaline phosphatase superfamily)